MPSLPLFTPLEEKHAIVSMKADALNVVPTAAGAFARFLESSAMMGNVHDGTPKISGHDKASVIAVSTEEDDQKEPIILDQAWECLGCAAEFRATETHFPSLVSWLGKNSDAPPEVTHPDDPEQLIEDLSEDLTTPEAEVRTGNHPSVVSGAADSPVANPQDPQELFAKVFPEVQHTTSLYANRPHRINARESTKEGIRYGQNEVSPQQPEDLLAPERNPVAPKVSGGLTSEPSNHRTDPPRQEGLLLEAAKTVVARTDVSRGNSSVQDDSPDWRLLRSLPETSKPGRHQGISGNGGSYPAEPAIHLEANVGLALDHGAEVSSGPAPKRNQSSAINDPVTHHEVDGSHSALVNVDPTQRSGNMMPSVSYSDTSTRVAALTTGARMIELISHLAEEDASLPASEGGKRLSHSINATVSAVEVPSSIEQCFPVEHKKNRDSNGVDPQATDSTGNTDDVSANAKTETPYSVMQSQALVSPLNTRIGSPPDGSDLARGIAVQIAKSMASATDSTIDIALNPEELGHITISLKPLEAGISVTIFTDRPDTADLMRRHIEALAHEFRAMGYTSSSFSFGQGAPQDQRAYRTFDGAKRRPVIASNPENTPAEARSKSDASGVLDLKL